MAETPESFKTKKQQIEEMAALYGMPILFRDDIQTSKKEIILVWSNGYKSVFSVKPKLALVEDNTKIFIDYELVSTGFLARGGF